MGRRLMREKTLQTLYQYELNEEARSHLIKGQAETLKKEADEDDQSFFKRLSQGVLQQGVRMDPVIQQYLKKDWMLSRLSLVDRIILRMALYELVFESDIPTGVTLNEAVELTKIFSTEESAKFINGVLGNIVKDLDEIKERLTMEKREA